MIRRRLSLIIILLLPIPAAAQIVIAPSSHFGASMFPDIEPSTYVGINFDRFTEFGKPTDVNGLIPYNDLETIGLNFVGISATRRWSRFRNTLYRVVAQIGYGHNQPTKWGQDFIHEKLVNPPIALVPFDTTRSAFDIGLSVEATRWHRFPAVQWLPLFAGGGMALSTVSQEVFFQAGARPYRWRYRGFELPTLSLMTRIGLAAGGDAFPSSSITTAHATLQASVRVPLDRWATDLLRALNAPSGVILVASFIIPGVEIIGTGDTGFFSSSSGGPIRERFITMRLTFVRGFLQIETWNDLINNKDKGPTGGLSLYYRTRF